MSINEVIVWILMICMALGAIDRAIGNRFGLGEKFEDGFNAMGPLALSMVGVYAPAARSWSSARGEGAAPTPGSAPSSGVGGPP